MPVIERQEDRIVVGDAQWRDKDRIKMVPGSQWSPQGYWTLPLSWASYVTMYAVFGDELRYGPALTQWLEDEYRNRIHVVKSIRTATHYAEREDVPFAFQEPGVDFLCWAKEALLGDEMGTGKTRQAVLALRKRYRDFGDDVFPVAIICPNPTKAQWYQHVEEFLPEATPFLIEGGKAKREKLFREAIDDATNPVVIINHEAVRLHSRLAPFGSVRLSDAEREPKHFNELRPRAVIVDEAHKMKDASAKFTRATWAVQHNDRCWLRWALTGTPIANDVGDLWAIMHGVSPSDYPTKSKFIDRFAMQSWNAFGGLDVVGVRPDTKDEFFAILDPHFRRMPKDLVLRYLPRKVRTRLEAPMKPSQAKAYKEMDEGMVTRLDDGRLVIATNNLTVNTRLLQFSSASVEVLDNGDVRLKMPSNKIDVMLEIVDASAKPIVVCAESRQLIMLAAEALEKKGITHRVLVGGMTSDQREAVKRDFIDGKAKVFLFTLKAGGTGLDGLQSQADTIVFLQRSWSLIDNKQAEDRVHRIGAEVHGESINIIDIVAPGTVEESQITALYDKMAQLEEIVRDRAALIAAGVATDDLDRLEAELLNTPLWAA